MSRRITKTPSASPALTLPDRWVVLDYHPVAPFALRTSIATSSGGKTLLVPTPYAIKLALVDAAIRESGVERGRVLFGALRACPIAITPPRWACVTNTFGRVLRLHEEKGKKKEPDDDGTGGEAHEDDSGGDRPLKRTIAYRELVVLEGMLRIAIGLRGGIAPSDVSETAALVNYFGRRGSFFQLVAQAEATAPDEASVVVDSAGPGREPRVLGDVACVLDDTGPEAEFDRVNTYADAKVRIGVERVLRHYLLPMRRVTSTHTFTIYQRVDVAGERVAVDAEHLPERSSAIRGRLFQRD